MAVRKDYDFNDKAGLLYVINTIKSKVTGWLQEYAKKEDLKNVEIDVDSELSNTSTNPLENRVVTSELEKKAPIANPEFTGTPKVPLAVAGSNDMQIANTAFVHQAVLDAFSDLTGISLEAVDALPETGKPNVIYVVPNADGGYDEYLYTNGEWNLIGTTKVDLTGYLKEEQLVPITEEEIDAMFADW